MRSLDRPGWTDGRVVGGVCAGLADRFGFDLLLLRIIFVLFAVAGAGLLVYLALWVLMPDRDQPRPRSPRAATSRSWPRM